jgi:hypothetical protein
MCFIPGLVGYDSMHFSGAAQPFTHALQDSDGPYSGPTGLGASAYFATQAAALALSQTQVCIFFKGVWNTY